MIESRIITIGGQLAVAMPEEFVRKLGVTPDASVQLRLTPDGDILLNFPNEALLKQLQVADSVIQRYPSALQELAK